MIDKVKEKFRNLSNQQQILLLAVYAHQLTITTRGGYEIGTESLSNGPYVRNMNEIQHRVTSAIVSRLRENSTRYPDDVLIDIIVGHNWKHLSCDFERAWRSAFGSDLE